MAAPSADYALYRSRGQRRRVESGPQRVGKSRYAVLAEARATLRDARAQLLQDRAAEAEEAARWEREDSRKWRRRGRDVATDRTASSDAQSAAPQPQPAHHSYVCGMSRADRRAVYGDDWQSLGENNVAQAGPHPDHVTGAPAEPVESLNQIEDLAHRAKRNQDCRNADFRVHREYDRAPDHFCARIGWHLSRKF
uniref:Uncharacterized protein n=1 Tax=Neobodo designis TaxID=312471 RepID=A0A7S1PRG3_NEODS|mmetsp:Transcript_16861/g.52368  ORF Transcript_16861/g.52368 Transcript_16861/m.52368 type:complete len:195 (+) Transcript_16861:59-643(+)|eukprot:CAMPEP_0174855500 /NCGR_PEP_ID=MMETSP1114-20130205/33438_1 /TAXON_ID=312471 /ORGANISM="Neobodo designis, Strain CCAP 1951/1" /LENGTH=194 /DNA_ID=CAMNT_0016090241 /DNA_START=57 /DNA_END=641 /DNA_ORIENTATION=+